MNRKILILSLAFAVALTGVVAVGIVVVSNQANDDGECSRAFVRVKLSGNERSVDVEFLNADLRPTGKLTSDGQSREPEFSPDGQRVVFASGRGYASSPTQGNEKQSIYLIDSDGDNERRLTRAAEARAFNWGLRQVPAAQFSHIGKLDGDLEIPPDYFERLLEKFEREPSLGITGGSFAEFSRGRWRPVPVPSYHVPGALKLYRGDCLNAITGIREHLGWDTIDETYARMQGFTTRSVPELVALHHRPCGSVGGSLRGRARYGECAYAARYPALWIALRSLKVATRPPLGISGVAFAYGYARAAVRRVPRVEDDEFRQFVRQELRGRLFAGAASAVVPRGAGS